MITIQVSDEMVRALAGLRIDKPLTEILADAVELYIKFIEHQDQENLRASIFGKPR